MELEDRNQKSRSIVTSRSISDESIGEFGDLSYPDNRASSTKLLQLKQNLDQSVVTQPLLSITQLYRTGDSLPELGDFYQDRASSSTNSLTATSMTPQDKTALTADLQSHPLIKYLTNTLRVQTHEDLENIDAVHSDEYIPPTPEGLAESKMRDKQKYERDKGAALTDANWKDGGNLQDLFNQGLGQSVTFKNQGVFTFNSTVRQDFSVQLAELHKQIATADYLLKKIISPAILQGIDRPRFTVDIGWRRSEFRAFQQGGSVYIAYDETPDTIMHEVGHYIENSMPALWEEVVAMREHRHKTQGGTYNLLGDSKPVAEKINQGEPDVEMQGRYAGNYPGTGEYTSKAYQDGATEIVSMTLEYFGRVDKMNHLIQNDPIQALTVLKHIRSGDALIDALVVKYDAFIPK